MNLFELAPKFEEIEGCRAFVLYAEILTRGFPTEGELLEIDEARSASQVGKR